VLAVTKSSIFRTARRDVETTNVDDPIWRGSASGNENPAG
jgi:hypothetical protein